MTADTVELVRLRLSKLITVTLSLVRGFQVLAQPAMELLMYRPQTGYKLNVRAAWRSERGPSSRSWYGIRASAWPSCSYEPSTRTIRIDSYGLRPSWFRRNSP